MMNFRERAKHAAAMLAVPSFVGNYQFSEVVNDALNPGVGLVLWFTRPTFGGDTMKTIEDVLLAYRLTAIDFPMVFADTTYTPDRAGYVVVTVAVNNGGE